MNLIHLLERAVEVFGNKAKAVAWVKEHMPADKEEYEAALDMLIRIESGTLE